MSLKKLVILVISVKVVFEVIRPRISGILGQNPNIFKPGQIKYQKEAFGPMIKEKVVFKVVRGH